MAEMTATSYPLTYDVEYPEELSRWLIFVKWLLAIPSLDRALCTRARYRQRAERINSNRR